MRSSLIDFAAGTAGGALGTWMLRTGMQRSGDLPEAVRPPEPRQDPGQFMVERAEARLGRPLPEAVKATATHGLHWAYGTGFGGLLGLFGPRLGVRRLPAALAAGAGLGALVWGVGYLGWLPASGLTRPVHRERASRTLTSLASHVLYGVVSALPLYAAEALLGRRPPRRRLAALARWL
jgi:hypothetical protein